MRQPPGAPPIRGGSSLSLPSGRATGNELIFESKLQAPKVHYGMHFLLDVYANNCFGG